MHLTGLSITCLDNPVQKTEKSIIDNIMRYLHNDVILYHQSEPEALFELQQKMWSPIIDWANVRFI